jgi:hypothetical protein
MTEGEKGVIVHVHSELKRYRVVTINDRLKFFIINFILKTV